VYRQRQGPPISYADAEPREFSPRDHGAIRDAHETVHGETERLSPRRANQDCAWRGPEPDEQAVGEVICLDLPSESPRRLLDEGDTTDGRRSARVWLVEGGKGCGGGLAPRQNQRATRLRMAFEAVVRRAIDERTVPNVDASHPPAEYREPDARFALRHLS